MSIVVAFSKLTCCLFLYSRTNDETKITTKNITKNTTKINDDESTNDKNSKNVEKTILRLNLFFKNESFDEISTIVFILRDVRKIDDKFFFSISLSFINYVTHELNVILFFQNLNAIKNWFVLFITIKIRNVFCNCENAIFRSQSWLSFEHNSHFLRLIFSNATHSYVKS